MPKKKRSEQPNKENCTGTSTIETEDYQFLLSLEENRKAALVGKASAIITVASLVLAIIIFALDNEKALFPSWKTESIYYVMVFYSILFSVTVLCCSSAIGGDLKTKERKDYDSTSDSILWKDLYLDIRQINGDIQKKIRISYNFLLITIITFLLCEIIIIFSVAF